MWEETLLMSLMNGVLVTFALQDRVPMRALQPGALVESRGPVGVVEDLVTGKLEIQGLYYSRFQKREIKKNSLGI